MDLTPLMPYLQQLGPWGWAVAAGIIILQAMRARRSTPAPATAVPMPEMSAIAIPRPPYAAGKTEADYLVALMQHYREAVAVKLAEHEAEAAKLGDLQNAK